MRCDAMLCQATPEALAAVAAPLVREGMLRKLRDPYFLERQGARASDEDPEGYRRLWCSTHLEPVIWASRPREHHPYGHRVLVSTIHHMEVLAPSQ